MKHLNELLDRIDALKEKVDARRPLTGTEPHQLQEYYRIGLTYASNALEGNTLDNAPVQGADRRGGAGGTEGVYAVVGVKGS